MDGTYYSHVIYFSIDPYRLMPVIKRPSHSIPWSQLRHMKKEERAQAKKEAISKVENVHDPKLGLVSW